MKRDIVVDSLRRIARIPDPVVTTGVALPAEGYRTTLRLAVDPEGRPALHRSASHDLIAVDDCLVAHPLLADLLSTGRWPGARSVTLRCGARTGETLVKVSPGRVGGSTARYFHEIAAGRRWRIAAASFFQARPDGADVLAAEIVSVVSGAAAASAVDLYCGVGLFAGALRRLRRGRRRCRRGLTVVGRRRQAQPRSLGQSRVERCGPLEAASGGGRGG